MDRITIRKALAVISATDYERKARIWYENDVGGYDWPEKRNIEMEGVYGFIARMGMRANDEALDYIADKIDQAYERATYPNGDPSDE